MKRVRTVRLVTFMVTAFIAVNVSATSVVVIAPSISTSQEARRVIAKAGFTETRSYKNADAVLVVVRSALANPLNLSYDCICELKRDAEGQLNIAGPQVHVYLYSIEDDLSSNQAKHISYDAR